MESLSNGSAPLQSDLQRELVSAARAEVDAGLSQLLLGVVRLVDRRASEPMQAAAVAEVLDNVSALAFRDELTGVLNRRGFLRQGAQLLRRASVTGQRATLFYADVNHLKLLNDSAGHAAGDALLARTGAVLARAFRREDVIGRLGGDEFAGIALSPDDRVERWMRRRLAESLACANADPARPQVSLSIGIASSTPQHYQSLDELIALADGVMYEQRQRRRAQSAARPGLVGHIGGGMVA